MNIDKLISFKDHHCQCYLREYVEKAGFAFCPCATLKVTKPYDPQLYEEVKAILVDITSLEEKSSYEKLAIVCERITQAEIQAHTTRCYFCQIYENQHIKDLLIE